MFLRKRLNSMSLFFLLFSLFVLISTAVLIAKTWTEVQKTTQVELHNVQNMVSSTFTSELQYYEILLQVLGNDLLENDVLENPEASRSKIQHLLNSDNRLAGFGVSRNDGQLILVSFIAAGRELPNILHNTQNASSFQRALLSKTLTIGHTYYMETLKQWIIPLRQAIYKKNGELAFIMTTGIKLDHPNHPWKFLDANSPIRINLIDQDFHFIYTSKIPKGEKEQWYTHPIPKNTIEQVQKLKLKEQESYFSMNTRKSKKILVSSKYDGKNQILFAISKPYDTLYQQTFEHLKYFLLGIIVFYIFSLIFYIINNAKDQTHTNKLIYSTEHDTLTSLPNRLFLEKKMQTWNLNNRIYSALFLDLDNFKFINDNYGHPFGDKLIVILAQRLEKLINSDEYAIRQGGDEFIIITRRAKNHIEEYAQHIINIINEIVHIDNISLHPKVSIGIAHYPDDANSFDTLMSKSDMALYEAKKNRCGYFTYSSTLEDASKKRLDIELELRNAIENNELYVLLQPQLNAKTLKIEGVEALVRWQNPRLGFIPPDQFISIAEEIGAIHQLGRFVLKQATLMLLDVYQQTNETFTLSVNSSVDELFHPDFIQGVLDTVTDNGFPKEQLIIEVTESLLIHDVQKAKNSLNLLRAENIGVSLDDFGTGFSSLNMLNGLPITELKIDQSFIRDILIDKQDLALAKAIINLAELFNLKTVAEGVEEVGQVHAMQEAGCSILQGYHFAKPLTKDELIAFIKNS